MRSLALPGNPRYQPKSLQEVFGYDNLVRTFVEVELAAMDTLAELGPPNARHAEDTDAGRGLKHFAFRGPERDDATLLDEGLGDEVFDEAKFRHFEGPFFMTCSTA